MTKLHNELRWKILDPLPGEEILWRSVWNKYQIDSRGRLKPGFFRDSSGVSCDIAVYISARRSIRGFDEIARPNGSGLAEFSVSAVRKVSETDEIDVRHNPLKLKNGKKNYAHALIKKNHGQLTTGEANRLRNKTRFAVKPNLSLIRG